MEDKTYTSEQIADAERLLNELAKVEKSERPIIVALIMAYLNGVEIGRMYAPDKVPILNRYKQTNWEFPKQIVKQ